MKPLTGSDFEAVGRAALKEYCQYRLGVLRVQNDTPKLGEVETGYLRGQIAELKTLLRQIDPVPVGEKRETYILRGDAS
jgi:hypothetical protein